MVLSSDGKPFRAHNGTEQPAVACVLKFCRHWFLGMDGMEFTKLPMTCRAASWSPEGAPAQHFLGLAAFPPQHHSSRARPALLTDLSDSAKFELVKEQNSSGLGSLAASQLCTFTAV